MQLMSATYLVVVACALAVHAISRRRRRWWSRGMAAVSVGACALFDPRLALAAVTGAIWVRIVTAGIRRRAHAAAWRRVGVAVAVVALAGTRFALFAVDTADAFTGWFGARIGWRPDSWWVPLGVSFLVFQVISVIVDVARDPEGEPHLSASETLLVLAFFPRVVAGPLVRAKSFVGELRSETVVGVPIGTVVVLVVGALFKKVVLAGILFDFDTATTAAGTSMTAWDAVVKMVAGPLRFLFDVSAYADLAVAVGLLVGVNLPANFDRPFGAWSVGEFWRRWHMSVSQWFRDYVQLPLTGRTLRPRPVRAVVAIVATMALSGLWHGATSIVIWWGVVHGVAIAAEWVAKYAAVGRRRRARRTGMPMPAARSWLRPLSVAATFAFVAFSSPLFAGSGWRSAVAVWSAVGSSWTAASFVTPLVAVTVVVSLLWCAVPVSVPSRVAGMLDSTAPAVQAAIAAIAVTAIVGFAGIQPPGFVYWRF